jgi:hypothetical protein
MAVCNAIVGHYHNKKENKEPSPWPQQLEALESHYCSLRYPGSASFPASLSFQPSDCLNFLNKSLQMLVNEGLSDEKTAWLLEELGNPS